MNQKKRKKRYSQATRKKKPPERNPIIPMLAFIVVVIFSSMLLRIYVVNEINQTMEEISHLKRVEASIINTNYEIKKEIQNLLRADRIQKIAREKLNMVVPEPETLVVRLE